VPNDNKTFSVGIPIVVDSYFHNLGFEKVFGPLKSKGVDINSLVRLLVTYKLVENHSIARAGDWAGQAFIRGRYGLPRIDQQTLYRTLERLGMHADEVMAGIQDALFERYDFASTDINLDWTSVVLHGNAAELGRYGYSRDHRPDKRQLTLGLCELAAPVNVPIGMTVREGNVNDQSHFADTYSQVRRLLKDGSLVVFDKGASSQTNKELVRYDRMHYLSSKKLNRSDDLRIRSYWKRRPEVVDPDKGIVGVIYEKPRSTDYLYFSKSLHDTQVQSAAKRARRMVDEAVELQRDLDAGKKVKKRFRGGVRGNVLIDAATTFQTKLADMSEEEAYDYAFSRCKNGREGFFCLKSSTHLTLAEALATYRKKDSIEKIFHSLKNEIEIKPVRCWKKERQIGVLLIGFLAQLFVSLLRYDLRELANTSTKFIKKSLRNLTETLVRGENGAKKRIFSNFDGMNKAILRNCGAIS
jgi:transposase